MSNSSVKYKETQVFHILLVFCAAFIIAFQLLLTFASGTYSSKTSAIILFAVFGLLVVLFYKLKITVTETQLNVSFGIGLIAIKFNLKDIDAFSIHTKDVPWYMGVGIRFTASGNWLFNTKPGKAVCFAKTNRRSLICIGSNTPEELEKVIKDLI